MLPLDCFSLSLPLFLFVFSLFCVHLQRQSACIVSLKRIHSWFIVLKISCACAYYIAPFLLTSSHTATVQFCSGSSLGHAPIPVSVLLDVQTILHNHHRFTCTRIHVQCVVVLLEQWTSARYIYKWSQFCITMQMRLSVFLGVSVYMSMQICLQARVHRHKQKNTFCLLN